MQTIRPPKFSCGVSFEPDVIQYLEQLGERTRLNRSWLINSIVREYARMMAERNVSSQPMETIINL